MIEKFYLEEPSLLCKQDALDYITERRQYNSQINESGSLHRYGDDYEAWLKKLEFQKNCESTDQLVPAVTYFLIRESDHKIIGMINIRLKLSEALKRKGGHIGYGIRPTERQKGYNKVNLYLGLQICEKLKSS